MITSRDHRQRIEQRIEAERERSDSEVARLNRCIVEYGKHSWLCVSVQLPVSSKGRCDCGFEQVYAAAVDALAKNLDKDPEQ